MQFGSIFSKSRVARFEAMADGWARNSCTGNDQRPLASHCFLPQRVALAKESRL